MCNIYISILQNKITISPGTSLDSKLEDCYRLEIPDVKWGGGGKTPIYKSVKTEISPVPQPAALSNGSKL